MSHTHRLGPREHDLDAPEQPPLPARPPVEPDQLPGPLDFPADPDPDPAPPDPKDPA